MTGRPSGLTTLREANFRFYFLSRLVNGVGSTIGGIALVFAVLEVSGSPSALGTVLAAHSIPMVVFLLAGGVIADRFGRTLVIHVSNVAAGVTQLVPRAQLQPANALMSVQRSVISIGGPTAGGLLVVTADAGWAVAAEGLPPSDCSARSSWPVSSTSWSAWPRPADGRVRPSPGRRDVPTRCRTTSRPGS